MTDPTPITAAPPLKKLTLSRLGLRLLTEFIDQGVHIAAEDKMLKKFSPLAAEALGEYLEKMDDAMLDIRKSVRKVNRDRSLSPEDRASSILALNEDYNEIIMNLDDGLGKDTVTLELTRRMITFVADQWFATTEDVTTPQGQVETRPKRFLGGRDVYKAKREIDNALAEYAPAETIDEDAKWTK